MGKFHAGCGFRGRRGFCGGMEMGGKGASLLGAFGNDRAKTAAAVRGWGAFCAESIHTYGLMLGWMDVEAALTRTPRRIGRRPILLRPLLGEELTGILLGPRGRIGERGGVGGGGGFVRVFSSRKGHKFIKPACFVIQGVFAGEFGNIYADEELLLGEVPRVIRLRRGRRS